ncbi:ATP-dependent nuclease [Pseudomonas sp. NPDC077649]|uniref:ATP-dependent nuclease n=1 Tax=Pseudomonas sp. NPDC077649 TaxID=3364423 RepID=UPI0037C6F72D
MKIKKFRILRFKSIIDTDWISFSPDQVTVLIGQNESGKSSILEALSKTFSAYKLTSNEIRAGEESPEIYLEYSLDEIAIKELLQKYNKHQAAEIIEILRAKNFTLTSKFYWAPSDSPEGGYTGFHEVIDDEVNTFLSTPLPADDTNEAENKILTEEEFSSSIFSYAPNFHFFDHESGLLPSTIDIPSDYKLTDRGFAAAKSYLAYAGIELSQLLTQDLRTQKSILHRANERISQEFSSFWSQTIGKSNKIKFECSLEKHDASIPEKAGKPFLAFFISDGLNRLYPHQRSTGVRWFLSFFLQLKSSEKRGKARVFLLDEPGSNLHSKAQKDVLGLINKLSKDITIIYSTHSPSLIEYEKLFRIYAVYRNDDLDDSPTLITEAHKLGASSSDTLSPLMSAMGADFSQQQTIQKTNNVILEEISGFYYLKSFWRLTKESMQAHFIAATGVNKIEPLAYMFTGWDLKFIIVVDDDSQARAAYNSLKRNLYQDNDDLARSNMLKIPNCQGIEDIFSKDDYAKYISQQSPDQVKTTNSEHIKRSNISKPIAAYKFMLSVENNEITLDDLSAETKTNISNLVQLITHRISSQT